MPTAQGPKSKTSDTTSAAVLTAARRLAGLIKADHILLVANSRIDRSWLKDTASSHSVVLALKSKRSVDAFKKSGYAALVHSSPPLDRFSRIAHAIISAMAAGFIDGKAKVVSVTGPIGKDSFDSITVVQTSSLFRELASLEEETRKRPDMLPVVKATLDIALELGAFGMEGRTVGTIFIIGDTASVLRLSRQSTFNPFRGYDDKQKNILNPGLRESIKTFAQIDGAFVIREDGTINAAGRLLLMPKGKAPILKGMGARHNAAAFVTKETDAISVVVSQTTGSVSVISRGRILFSLNPASRTASALYTRE